MALTIPEVKNAAYGKDKNKLFDGKGLHLLLHKNGAKYWRLKFRFAGKEKSLALGVYPEISLSEARDLCDEARAELRKGIDPCQLKQATKAERKDAFGNTFEAVGLDWFDRQAPSLAAETLKKRKWILETKLFPAIGSSPIKDITPPQVLRVIRKIEDKGTIETASRAKQVASQVFRYAVAQGLCEQDPTRDLKGALKPTKTNHHAAIIKPSELARLATDIDSYDGTPVVTGLLKLTILLFQRPGEMRQMEWAEIDFENAVWEIPEGKMKMGIAHSVPLPTQALAILDQIKPFTIKRSKYVFAAVGKRNRPASDATVTRALRKMGYGKDEMTAHGFRATARTLLDEVLEFPPHLIEQQIAHAVRDPLGRAYNRTSHLKQRIEMMQVWADYLDGLKG